MTSLVRRRTGPAAALAAGLAVLFCGGPAPAGTLALKSTGTSRTPSIIGYNHGYFEPGGNAGAWWRYAGVNGVRIFINPIAIEPSDDLPPRGDGVDGDAAFESRKAALRADPFNPAYINWTAFNNSFTNGGWAYALGQYRALNLQVLVQITASETALPIADSSDYAGRWELWQHYYASAFYYARFFDVERYQMFNEPNHANAGGITTSEWLLRLQLASDAIRHAVEDVNSRYGKSLQAVVHAPVTAGTAYSPWGETAVLNRHRNYRNDVDDSIWILHRYDYHQYDASGSGAYSAATGLKSSIAADMPGETPFPLCLSEFNVHTAANFDGMEDTLDYPAKYARLGALLCNLAKGGVTELFCFKFTQTPLDSTYGVKKNGMHYADNDRAPHHHGGVTKAGEVYRLFNKGLAPGRTMTDYARDGDGSLDGLDLRAGYDAATRSYYLFSVNESDSSVPMTVNATNLDIPAGNRILLEEVSENRHGSGRTWGSIAADKTLFDGGDNVWWQPAKTAWLWTLPVRTQQVEQTVYAAEDATVRDGANAGVNYGAAANLLARNDPTDSANRGAALLKFDVPPIHPPDLQFAVLRLDTRATAPGTAQGHVYGLDADSWSESTVTWSNAPNLKKDKPAGNRIADRVIDGEGAGAHILGQLVATSTNASAKLIDVTGFVRAQPDRTVSFLVAQDPRWDTARPSMADGDTQPAGLDIASSESASPPALLIVRLKDTDDDGLGDEAETATFLTDPDDADTDDDGLSDGMEILTTGTDPTVSNAPALDPVADRTLGAGQTMTVTNTATDVDLPAQTLTFGLLLNPTGAAIGASSGILAWRPAVAQADSTNLFRVRVADNGAPALSATQQFSVVVRPLAVPSVAQPAAAGGQFALTLAGDAGPDYAVEASTNLVDWISIFTTNSPDLPLRWTDPDAYNLPRRFYRARPGP